MTASPKKNRIRIGNGAGFWGDQLDAPRKLAEAGKLDYLTLEYLAELTMSILAHLKSRDPAAGFVTDFPTVIQTLIPTLQTQPEFKIVSNAGGVNPVSCAKTVGKLLVESGLPTMMLGVVSGDDLLGTFDEHLEAGEQFLHLETGKPLGELRESIVSANAYLGASGIVAALNQQATIVITGRVADASLTVGPAMFEFGWRESDLKKLAAATVAGHLIECGAQVTGGMFSRWTSELDLTEVGYPIAELTDTGDCVITKPAGTGGIVNRRTVAEQLVYEIGDPTAYLTPDVTADFSNVVLEEIGEDSVQVSGGKGYAAPEKLKVSICYHAGWKATGSLVVCGSDAVTKAKLCADMILKRTKAAGFELTDSFVEIVGSGDVFPRSFQATGVEMSSPDGVQEVVLKLSARANDRAAIERFSREFAPLVTSGPPGVTGYTGGRAKPQRVLAYWPTTISRNRVQSETLVKTAEEWAET